MNKKFNFDQSTIRILYYRNKEYIIPSAIILICLILFIKFIIPQGQELFLIKEKEKETQARVENLKKNLNFLSSVDSSDLDSKLEIASNALPPKKDFAGIINAISDGAINSGVALDDFGFTVGELSTKSAKLNTQPSIQINLSVKSDKDRVRLFLKKLAKAFPLSEVTSVQMNNNLTTMVTVFYYKPFPPIEIDDYALPGNLSAKETKLINEMSSWE
ncbi:MAG: hypothetical protein A3H79_00160 [Candidatus Levybacteria bacterium RIFCSPLOWO2_02_FULL_36_8b]|nr:MAG: hypothetical protein A3H79_00160 [Candidatus Levybacteria bacterium RIFCSPLOWO2_02_FULL_36_8b]